MLSSASGLGVQLLLVPRQVGPLRKLLVTDVARMRPLVAVHGVLVRYEIILLAKGLAALVTFVGSYLLVDGSDVLVEVASLREADGALVTLVRAGSLA